MPNLSHLKVSGKPLSVNSELLRFAKRWRREGNSCSIYPVNTSRSQYFKVSPQWLIRIEQSCLRTLYLTKNKPSLLLYTSLSSNQWSRSAGELQFYCSVIRSVLDSARQIFHRSLPSYLSDEIERIQQRAMRTVFFLTVNTVWH